ncbi:MAG: hypothetical protein HY038_05320 [Nitrospirae bacterium]|nr:hypothetical protein [Nitrospirota bacterium]
MDGVADAVRTAGTAAPPSKDEMVGAVATGFSCVEGLISLREVPLDKGDGLGCGEPVAATGAVGVSVDESTFGFFVSL